LAQNAAGEQEFGERLTCQALHGLAEIGGEMGVRKH
jgi:hypothetical protein